MKYFLTVFSYIVLGAVAIAQSTPPQPETTPLQQQAPPPPTAVPDATAATQPPPAPQQAEGEMVLDVFKTTFVYDPQGKRDPFLPPDIERPLEPVRMHGPLTPLEKFPLDKLKITGIMWDVRQPKAMVRDPDGKLHVVRRNDRLGSNNGYIAVIREGELVVVENIEAEGKKFFTTRIMQITR